MRSAPSLLVVLALSLTLAGCVADVDPVVIDPEPSSSPIFESDEEALAAAEEALRAYYEVSDQIIIEGGVDSERLEQVSTHEIAVQEAVGHGQLAERGWRGVGYTSVDTISLQAYDPSAGPTDEAVTIYACVDISQFDLVDESGASVVQPSREVRTPFEVGFEWNGEDGLTLLRKEPWTGENFCAL